MSFQIDKKYTTFSVFLNISKIFDSLNHLIIEETPISCLKGHYSEMVYWPYMLITMK